MTAPDKSGDLCTRCGMCCDGTLFSYVALEPEEVERIRARGLEVDVPEEGDASFQQSCSALCGTRCSIYEDRPDACKRYRCLLLTALEDEEISFEEALPVVEQARELLGKLDAALDAAGAEAGVGSVTQRARLAHKPAHGKPLPPDTRQLMLDVGEFLTEYFRGKTGD